MTVIAASLERGGLLFPTPSSNAVSPAAGTLRRLVESTRAALADSLAVRNTAEEAIRELRRVIGQASKPNWEGYGARAIDERAYEHAIRFLQALPTTTPVPDVSVDPDGEIDLLWHVDSRKTFSVSVGPNGRLTYSGLFEDNQSYGTEWFFYELPQPILLNLARMVDDAAR